MTGRHPFRLVLLCSLFAPASGFLTAQPPVAPGETVVVAKDGVQLGVRDKPMETVNAGTQIVVTEVRGKWLGGFTYRSGNKRYGWVHESEIRRIAPAPRPPSGPTRPDQPQAVEAWKKLGVALHFDELGNVQQIRAEAAAVQNQDLVHLAGLPSLLSLDLSNQPITDEGMKQVAGCHSLQKLYLGGTGIGDAGIQLLGDLGALQVLACPKTQVTGDALQYLAPCGDLRVLNLSHCQVSDNQLIGLNALTHIEVLVLAHTQITDVGLEHLRPLTKLRVLNLDGTSVVGPGFDHLLGLSELRMLYVRNCPVELGVTDRLDDKLPGLAIYD